MSADPFVPDVKDAQSYNRYSYVRNNPIVYVDPTGHFFDFIGEIIGAIGGAISAIGNAIASAASWAWSKLGEAGRFLKRAGQYAWMIMKGMVSRPESLFLVAVGLLISIANPAVGVPLWAKGMAIAIAAQSVAAAAGIRGPVLSIIPAAGALAGGGFSATNIIRVASSVVPDLAIQAIGDASLKRELSVLSALAAFVTSAFLSSKEQGGSAEEVTRTKGGSRTSLDSEQTRQCADVAPMPNTAPNPYPEDYFYRWVSARYMFYNAGNGTWGNIVKGCLVCMYDLGIDPNPAHGFCYGAASDRVSLAETISGFADAVRAAEVYWITTMTYSPSPTMPYIATPLPFPRTAGP